MKIIKRNGSEETFNIEKIINAIRKANNSADSPFLTEEQITDIADYVEYKCNKIKRAVSVEEIQDMVEDQLMAKGAFELARRYVRYRYNRSLVRKANTTDNRKDATYATATTVRSSARRTPPTTAFSR